MTKTTKEKTQKLRLLVGSTYVPLFLSAKELEKLESALKSQSNDWTSVTNTAGEQIDLRLSQVMMVGRLKQKGPATPDGTIPIAQLAEFAGVAPITITRLFPDTLRGVSDRTDKYRRATKATAIALRSHLVKSGRDGVKSEREFLRMFGEN